MVHVKDCANLGQYHACDVYFCHYEGHYGHGIVARHRNTGLSVLNAICEKIQSTFIP
jgi:hypothetical protein